MTIIQKSDDDNFSIVLDNIVEINKSDSFYTAVARYEGFYCIDFKTISGKTIQWDYGRSKEGQKLRDEEYLKIIKSHNP